MNNPIRIRHPLDHAPRGLLDLSPADRRVAHADRHHHNRERWLQLHAEAGLSAGDRVRRAVRRWLGR